MTGLDELIQRSRARDKVLVAEKPNLLPLVQGIFEGPVCTRVFAHLSIGALEGIRSSVKSRVLDLTFELEGIPGAVEITFDSQSTTPPEESTGAAVTQAVNKTIYGDNIEISNSGPGAQFFFDVEVKRGDFTAFTGALTKAGMPRAEAEELANIASTEGERGAMAWLGENARKLAGSVSVSAIASLILRFFGL